MQINEHGKLRQVNIDDGYEYNETIYNESGNAIEFFNACLYSDFSFLYVSFNEAKVGNLTIELDSAFYKSFSSLLGELDTLRIDDDFSERFIEFKKNEDGEIEIEIHLLPNEKDGEITIKNIMYDLRSKVDQYDKDTKKRLKSFFSEISHVFESVSSEENKKLELKE